MREVAWFSQALDLVVDLLQLARRRQHVLRVVGGVEDDPLRAGWRGGEGKRGDAGREGQSNAKASHWAIS